MGATFLGVMSDVRSVSLASVVDFGLMGPGKTGKYLVFCTSIFWTIDWFIGLCEQVGDQMGLLLGDFTSTCRGDGRWQLGPVLGGGRLSVGTWTGSLWFWELRLVREELAVLCFVS